MGTNICIGKSIKCKEWLTSIDPRLGESSKHSPFTLMIFAPKMVRNLALLSSMRESLDRQAQSSSERVGLSGEAQGAYFSITLDDSCPCGLLLGRKGSADSRM